MSIKKFNIILIFIIGVVTGCGVKVTSTESKDKIRQRKTYSWVEEPPANKVQYNRELRRKVIEVEIRREIDEKLKAKGFEYDSSNPDFIVNYKALYIKERFDNTITRSSLTGYTGGSALNLNSMPIAQNTLSVGIQLLEPKSKLVLWSGNTTRSLGDVMTLTKIVDQEVAKVINKLPKNKAS